MGSECKIWLKKLKQFWPRHLPRESWPWSRPLLARVLSRHVLGEFPPPKKNSKLPPRSFVTSLITTWILELKCNANYLTKICYLLSEVLLFVDKCAKSPNSLNLCGFNKLYRARDTIELLRRTTSDFVTPDMFPPNSPDLDLVDYVIWSVI